MFSGAITALVTPFNDYNIDYKAMEKFIEFQIKEGIDALLVCGTTGETPALSTDEKWDIIKFVVEKTDKRRKIIAGTGTNNTIATIENNKKAADLGVNAALVVVPYYNKPNQAGMIRHFEMVADKSEIPVIIYNVPGRTAKNMEADTAVALSKHPNICGIKEASGDITQIMDICRKADKGFDVLSGDDGLTLPIMAAGGKGVISVTSNILPAMVSGMIKKYLLGEIEEAKALHYKLFDIHHNLFLDTNPVPVKMGLELMSLMNSEVRLPLFPANPAVMDIIRNNLIELGVIG